MICPSCDVDKPVEEFGRNRTVKSGRNPICRLCSNARVRQWWRDHPAARRAKTLRRNGATPELYAELLDGQGGGCAICYLPESENRNGLLHVDHDHATGIVRGLLCNRCNTALGLMLDDPERLDAAAGYLRATG